MAIPTPDILKQMQAAIALLPKPPVFDAVYMHPANIGTLQQAIGAATESAATYGFAGMDIGYQGDLCGIRVISAPAMVVQKQTRFPRSKKRRIRRKWARRYTATVPDDRVFMVSQREMHRMMQKTMDDMLRACSIR